MSDFQEWLRQVGGRRPVTLVETSALVSGVETPVYLSDQHYIDPVLVDGPQYLAVITGSVSITEKLDIDGAGGAGGMSSGDIQLINADGSLDEWLGWVWTNRRVQVLLGDAAWPRSEFVPVFSGVIAGAIDSPSADRLAFKLRDALQRLNAPVHEQKLGGSGENSDALLPLALGHVFNVAPLLIDAAQHIYRVSLSGVDQIVEVRDDGLPVGFVGSPGSGTFRLTQKPLGQITADVVAAGVGTVRQLVQVLATQYGKAAERFDVSEIDAASFSALASACPQPIGRYLADRDNVLSVCQGAAASVGAQLTVSRAGALRLVRLAAPGVPVAEIGPADIIAGSLKIAQRPDIRAGVKLQYAGNSSPQTSFDGGCPPAHQQLYRDEWQTATASDSAVAAAHRLHADPDSVETWLVRKVDAQAEAARRLELSKRQQTVYGFDAAGWLLGVTVGDTVRLSHWRFGLDTGVLGVVVQAEPDYVGERIGLQVSVWNGVPADVPAPAASAGYQHESVRVLQAASPRVLPVALPSNVTVSGAQVTGALSSSVTINGTQIAGGVSTSLLVGQISTSMLQSNVVTANTINTYSLSANQITSGTINTSLLQSDVVKASTINTYSLSANQITSGTISARLLDSNVVLSSNLQAMISDISLLTVNDIYSRRGMTAQNYFHCYGLFGVSGAAWFSGDVHFQRPVYAEQPLFLRGGGEALEAWQTYKMDVDGVQKTVVIHR